MSRPTLTRTEQVLKVLHKGGRIEATGERGMLRLVDWRGNEIPAWQTAMKTAQKLAAALHPSDAREGLEREDLA